METIELTKLAEVGSMKQVEETWLSLLETDATPTSWQERSAVLDALVSKGKTGEAESMAVTAVEWLAERISPEDTLDVAAAFLLAVRESDELRLLVGDLYRKAHGGVVGVDSLLHTSGIDGSRPARRALRTLQVAARLREGSYVAHRHEDTAARVEKIDTTAWHVDLVTAGGKRSLGIVELADNYEPADEDDVRVMASFHPERMGEALRDDPAEVIIGILQRHGGKMDSDSLQAMLSPRFIPADEWTKWWTKARQALRLSPHVSVEGRAPYYLKYDEEGTTLEQEIESRLKKTHDPERELAIVEEYVRGCKARKREPKSQLLASVRQRIIKRAKRGGRAGLTPWLVAQKIGEMLGDEKAGDELIAMLKERSDPAEAILAIHNPAFWPEACAALEAAAPGNLAEALERLLPHAPIAVADHLAERLVELGTTSERFQELFEGVLKDPVMCSEAVAWAWNGPAIEQARPDVPLVTIFGRLLQALGAVKRRDDIDKDHAKRVVGNVRDALRARDYQRFREMIEQIDAEMAIAIRTQVKRSDNLGRAAYEDLVKLIDQKFPDLLARPVTPKWQQAETLYVTVAGLRKRKAELDELVNVKMRENAIAIGRAAEHGDLSENSEYKFALEERDLLRSRYAQMQKELEASRVLTADEVPTDHVGIGSVVVVEHTGTGQRHDVTILGPWEADIARHIYNYRTPLAQTLLGRRVGDVANVDFFQPPGEYRIAEIGNALSDQPSGASA